MVLTWWPPAICRQPWPNSTTRKQLLCLSHQDFTRAAFQQFRDKYTLIYVLATSKWNDAVWIRSGWSAHQLWPIHVNSRRNLHLLKEQSQFTKKSSTNIYYLLLSHFWKFVQIRRVFNTTDLHGLSLFLCLSSYSWLKIGDHRRPYQFCTPIYVCLASSFCVPRRSSLSMVFDVIIGLPISFLPSGREQSGRL